MTAKGRARVRRALAAAVLFASVCAAEERVVITDQQGQWEMAYGDVYYRVVGNVRNESGRPIRYVKLEVDLLDKDGKVVKTFSGYNQKAETLGEVGGEGVQTVEQTSLAEKAKKIQPLAPGEKDLFRIGVGKEEIPKQPKFASYRVRIVEVK